MTPREQIASIIGPDGWDKVFEKAWGPQITDNIKADAFRKADSILAMQRGIVEGLVMPRPTSATVGLLQEQYVGHNAALTAYMRALGMEKGNG